MQLSQIDKSHPIFPRSETKKFKVIIARSSAVSIAASESRSFTLSSRSQSLSNPHLLPSHLRRRKRRKNPTQRPLQRQMGTLRRLLHLLLLLLKLQSLL